MAERMYTIKELQELLQLSRSTINLHIANGTLGSIKLGRARRIPESELQKFINSGKNEGK